MASLPIAKRKLRARGEYSSCWAEATGRVQFLFGVEVRPDTVESSQLSHPLVRGDARALPFVEDILPGPTLVQRNLGTLRGIFQQSDARQCRHTYQLRASSRMPFSRIARASWSSRISTRLNGPAERALAALLRGRRFRRSHAHHFLTMIPAGRRHRISASFLT